MIQTKELKTYEDFATLQSGDFIACEFHRNVYQGARSAGFRFNIFEIHSNKKHTHEIILNKQWNNYFNYKMFTEKDGGSNLKSAILIIQIEENN